MGDVHGSSVDMIVPITLTQQEQTLSKDGEDEQTIINEQLQALAGKQE